MLSTAEALAADGSVQLAQSSLVATFRQQRVPVDAAFKKFSGSIAYDAAEPATTTATLSVDMTSLDVGDDDTNAEVRKPAWFDSAHYPLATFRATTVVPRVGGGFDASGPLTIKGQTRPVTVTVTVARRGAATSFDGSFGLSRKAFAIGDPAWAGLLDDEVRVHFHLVVSGP